MNTINLAVLISTVVVVALLWMVIGRKHLKHLAEVVDGEWERVDERLRKRHNLAPNLVETVRKFYQDQEELLQNLIDVRIRAAKEYGVSAMKMEFEHDLTKVINRVMDLGGVLKDLSQDTNFLELRKEFDEIEKEIEEMAMNYNGLVRSYNMARSWIWLRPISTVFGYKMMNIFEVER